MAYNKLIHLTSNDWCWLIIGILFGILLTFIFLYVYTYLPTLTEVQRTGLICTVGGVMLGYVINKFQWEESDD